MVAQVRTSPLSFVVEKATRANHSLVTLFGQSRFRVHRLVGLIFLVQYAMAVPAYLFSYQKYLQSPLVWSVPLTGVLQSLNAALTFSFLPKTDVPGFAATADKSVLSYYTVVENSFYAAQLLFVSCYLRQDLRERISSLVIVEPYFVFLPFFLRNVLWHSSRMGAALRDMDKGSTEGNRLKMIVSTYAIKGFYLLAKHFVGFLPNYMIFLGRITPSNQQDMYGIQVLSSYAATVSIFIHTLKFKGYIGPITALVAYDIIIPGFAYLYWNMTSVFLQNFDLAILCAISLFLNLVPRWSGNRFPWKYIWHAYQFSLMLLFHFGGYFGCQLRTGPVDVDQLRMSWEGLCGNPPAVRSLKQDVLAVAGCVVFVGLCALSGVADMLPRFRAALKPLFK
mmetsp:Transcript_76955/g.135625  ORF Transcript_76955/g.135625 Transcript_76955/m.135625 type:complete len:393 (-) Transcript_76955:76-1254(-)